MGAQDHSTGGRACWGSGAYRSALRRHAAVDAAGPRWKVVFDRRRRQSLYDLRPGALPLLGLIVHGEKDAVVDAPKDVNTWSKNSKTQQGYRDDQQGIPAPTISSTARVLQPYVMGTDRYSNAARQRALKRRMG